MNLTGESLFNVPAQNSVLNLSWGDVIGNKTDTHEGDSIYARLDELYDHWQAERKVYPTLAAGATVVAPAGVWAYGNYATVVPINTIANDYHVTVVSVESCSVAAGVFQLELYKGAADDIITAVRFAVVGGFFGNQVYDIGSEEVDANDQIRARVASSVGAATLTISVVYLEHV